MSPISQKKKKKKKKKKTIGLMGLSLFFPWYHNIFFWIIYQFQVFRIQKDYSVGQKAPGWLNRSIH